MEKGPPGPLGAGWGQRGAGGGVQGQAGKALAARWGPRLLHRGGCAPGASWVSFHRVPIFLCSGLRAFFTAGETEAHAGRCGSRIAPVQHGGRAP